MHQQSMGNAEERGMNIKDVNSTPHKSTIALRTTTECAAEARNRNGTRKELTFVLLSSHIVGT